MFSNAKVGDRVWSYIYDWGTIREINKNSIIVHYDCEGFDYYKFDGRLDYLTYKKTNQTLFWNEFEIPKEAYIKPLPKLEIDTKVLVWNNYKKTKRYFSHFDKDGKIVCFANGSTSFTNDGLTTWNNWELYNEK